MAKTADPIHRLRLTRGALEELIKAVDRTESNAEEQADRDSVRHPINRPAVFAQNTPGERWSRHEVYVRNLSLSGASVLHSAFVQPRSECTLTLLTASRRPITVKANVVRCAQIAGHIHDVGFRFVRPLTNEEAADLCDPGSSAFSTASMSPHALADALRRCKELASTVHDMIEAGASPEEVLPLLDELRSLEPVSEQAA